MKNRHHSDSSDLLAEASHIRAKLEEHFASDTALGAWDRQTPSSGHCAAVAILARELLGGQFVSSTVQGESHWFNRVEANDVVWDLDLTGDQFGEEPVQFAERGSLYQSTKVRNENELKDETVKRARKLAVRAGFIRIAKRLDQRLENSN